MGMLYIVLTWEGTTKTLDYSKKEGLFAKLTVGDMKAAIIEQENLVTAKIKVFFEGRELDDDSKTTDTYGIGNESKLTVVKIVTGEMSTINIKFKDQPLVKVNYCLEGTIYDLKQAISDQLHIPQSLQILSANGKPIDENEFATFRSLAIPKETEILLELAPFLFSYSPSYC